MPHPSLLLKLPGPANEASTMPARPAWVSLHSREWGADVKDVTAAWKPRNRGQAGWAPQGSGLGRSCSQQQAQGQHTQGAPRPGLRRCPAYPFGAGPFLLQRPRLDDSWHGGHRSGQPFPQGHLQLFSALQPVSPGQRLHMPGSPEPCTLPDLAATGGGGDSGVAPREGRTW